jgi:hypothetical protein
MFMVLLSPTEADTDSTATFQDRYVKQVNSAPAKLKAEAIPPEPSYCMSVRNDTFVGKQWQACWMSLAVGIPNSLYRLQQLIY